MEQSKPPGALGSTEGLGPNALTYARERVSLLGAGEHIDTVNRALDALDGLPGAALLGGWTFKGFTAWAQGLENEIARLREHAVILAETAREVERERCAKLCDVAREAVWPYHAAEVLKTAQTVCENLANRIRGIGA